MTRQPVTSTSIRSIGHDPDTQELEVEFTSGACYAYAGVPRALYEKLLAAESIGTAFHHHVKKAGFRFAKREPGAERL